MRDLSHMTPSRQGAGKSSLSLDELEELEELEELVDKVTDGAARAKALQEQTANLMLRPHSLNESTELKLLSLRLQCANDTERALTEAAQMKSIGNQLAEAAHLERVSDSSQGSHDDSTQTEETDNDDDVSDSDSAHTIPHHHESDTSDSLMNTPSTKDEEDSSDHESHGTSSATDKESSSSSSSDDESSSATDSLALQSYSENLCCGRCGAYGYTIDDAILADCCLHIFCLECYGEYHYDNDRKRWKDCVHGGSETDEMVETTELDKVFIWHLCMIYGNDQLSEAYQCSEYASQEGNTTRSEDTEITDDGSWDDDPDGNFDEMENFLVDSGEFGLTAEERMALDPGRERR